MPARCRQGRRRNDGLAATRCCRRGWRFLRWYQLRFRLSLADIDEHLVTLHRPVQNRFAHLYPVTGFQPLRIRHALVVMEQRQRGIGGLDIGMSVGDRDMRRHAPGRQPRQHHIAMLGTAHREWQLVLADTLFATYIVNEVIPTQTGSSQRISTGGGACPGRTVNTARTSR